MAPPISEGPRRTTLWNLALYRGLTRKGCEANAGQAASQPATWHPHLYVALPITALAISAAALVKSRDLEKWPQKEFQMPGAGHRRKGLSSESFSPEGWAARQEAGSRACFKGKAGVPGACPETEDFGLQAPQAAWWAGF